MNSSLFRFWSYGGSGEVGMNSLFFEFGEQMIPVDAGIVFASENDYGIQSLHADYKKFFTEHQPRVWLITHAHEDHIGAAAAVLEGAHLAGAEIPRIICPPLAAELIREKVREDVRYPHAHLYAKTIEEVELNKWWEHGDIEIKFIEGRHSTLQTCAVAFRWRALNGELKILHTSDFKMDNEEYVDGVKGPEIYDVFDGKRPDFVFIDSTNSEREGRAVSEAAIVPNLRELFDQQEGRIFATCFASNLYRLATLLSLARDTGRAACLAGRSLQNIYRIAQKRGFFGSLCADVSGVDLLSPEELAARSGNKQLIICSGSQGEQRSVLSRLASGRHPNFRVREGDAVVFSSKTIPGNEKSVSWLINSLLRAGARVYSGEVAVAAAGGPIHGSGHARAAELRELLQMLRPKNVIPVHGELRQLRACAELAEDLIHSEGWVADVHVSENLTKLSFAWDGDATSWSIVDREEMDYEGRILRFENFTAHSLDPFLRDRKDGASGGVVSLAIDEAGRCRLSIRGVVPLRGELAKDMKEGLEEQILEWAQGKHRRLTHENAFLEANRSKFEESMSDELSRYVRRITGARPVAICHLVAL